MFDLRAVRCCVGAWVVQRNETGAVLQLRPRISLSPLLPCTQKLGRDPGEGKKERGGSTVGSVVPPACVLLDLGHFTVEVEHPSHDLGHATVEG